MIDLYTFTTPNGRKISIALEELGLPYNVKVVDILANQQFKPEYLAINPNNKIPAIVDSEGPGGQPFTLFESGAILIYLAEKTGRLLPVDPARRYHAIQWLMFQMSAVGPIFGQLSHFTRFSKVKVPYAIDRFTAETQRILGVMEKALSSSEHLAGGEYSIADIASYAWVLAIQQANPQLFNSAPHVREWLHRVGERPAVKRGMEVPKL